MTNKQQKAAMTKKQEKAIRAMRDTLHDHCQDMKPDEYREVLEVVGADIKAELFGLDEEAEGE